MPTVQTTALELESEARIADGRFEIFKVRLPALDSILPGNALRNYGSESEAWRWIVARLSREPNAFVFASSVVEPEPARRKGERLLLPDSRPRRALPSPQPAAALWVRRKLSSEPVAGEFYTPSVGGQPGHRIPFLVRTSGAQSTRNALTADWARAASAYFAERSSAFHQFASARLRERQFGAPGAAAARGEAWRGSSDFAKLMQTTTGRISVQEAIERDARLYLAPGARKQTLAIEALQAPRLGSHDWDALLQSLGKPGPEEVLARATPAEFCYARARSLDKLLDLVDAISDWGEPAAALLDNRGENRGSVERYETELGLIHTGLARTLGPALIDQLAVVGSDPYVHEGSDLTLLIQPKSPTLLEAALSAMLASRALEHGGVTQRSFAHEGFEVRADRSADGRIHRYRASSDGLELVSNSENGLRRVLSTVRGTKPRLSDEKDFRYMLARDASAPGDVLLYLGERFIQTVVGPGQKIAEARRQLALSELSRPAYAALLTGYLDGETPKSLQTLLEEGLLRKNELSHFGGEPIEFAPGSPPRSKWGTPDALTPLIDLPAVTRVSQEERVGYESFARVYENAWSDYVDPVALRVSSTQAPNSIRTIDASLRVLPLLRHEYREMLEMAGDARITAAAPGSGLRAVFGIGEQAELRRELNRSGSRLLGTDRVKFDWLGDFAMLGLADRNELLVPLKAEIGSDLELPDGDPRSPSRSFEDELAGFPAYAVVAVKSEGAAALALTALRASIDETAPSVVTWSRLPAYRSHPVVAVNLGRLGRLTIYYALTPTALAISLNLAALYQALDQLVDHPPQAIPSHSPAARDASQIILDLSASKESALATALTWLVASAFEQTGGSAREIAEAVFRGAPEFANDRSAVRGLMRAYFGTEVLTVDGFSFVPSPEGARDPVRGTPHAPSFPSLPIPGSSLSRVLSQLKHLRTEVGFDPEGTSTPDQPLFSLHSRVRIELQRDPTRAAEMPHR